MTPQEGDSTRFSPEPRCPLRRAYAGNSDSPRAGAGRGIRSARRARTSKKLCARRESPYPLFPSFSELDDNPPVERLHPPDPASTTMYSRSATRNGRRFRPFDSPPGRYSWERATSPAYFLSLSSPSDDSLPSLRNSSSSWHYRQEAFRTPSGGRVGPRDLPGR